MERVLKLLVTLAAYVVLTCLLNLVFVLCFLEFILHRRCTTAASGFLIFSC